MMNSTMGGTVTTTKFGSPKLAESHQNNNGDAPELSSRAESNPVARKRRMTEQLLSKTSKTPRRAWEDVEEFKVTEEKFTNSQTSDSLRNGNPVTDIVISRSYNHEVLQESTAHMKVDLDAEEEREDCILSKKPPMHPDLPRKRLEKLIRRDDSARLRKTIQWLEEGARKMREDLAEARSELHEERKASRMARREIETAVREARNQEAIKHQRIIAELKARFSQSPSRVTPENPACSKAELLKEENHRREISAAKRRLVEADDIIRKLKSNSLDSGGKKKKRKCLDDSELRKLECENRNLREAINRLEKKLQIAIEAEKSRTVELRAQHEKHDAEMSALKKALRSDTIKMIEEIRMKNKEIEKLKRLVRKQSKAINDDLMRKLRESERGHQIRLAPQIEEKIPRAENAMNLCEGECEALGEVERLRELAVDQQEVIEYLRQALKERERKLDQLSNKKKKEEFYKQWLELEPVAEVDDEEGHEEGDSALSSAPSSLSPQPGGWQANGVTREAYETLLLEVDEIQTKYLEEHRELAHAKSQVRDLEKALLQETRGSQNSRRALSDKLKEAEEREAGLLAEISELREQNELLEFRVLELEETGPRDSPDTADSGIVSPEPNQIFKDQGNKQRDRAIATVIPYNSYSQSMSPVPVQKSPLSLQESGIFEEEDEHEHEVELASCGTQTETPAGELLQEVQRLQELRERIQERAAKGPVPLETSETVEDNRLASYKERIRELEERLGMHEEADEKRSRDQLVAKQREEDLLDENYRLTERVYWLENELKNLQNAKKKYVDVGTSARIYVRDASTSTDVTIFEYADKNVVFDVISPQSRCHKIFRDTLDNFEDKNSRLTSRIEVNDFRVATELIRNKNCTTECSECESLRKDYDDKIRQLAQAECCFRRQMIDLERKEGAFAKTLQQVDVTWSQLEIDQAARLEKIAQELAEKTMISNTMLKRICALEKSNQNYSCCETSHHQDEVDMMHHEIKTIKDSKAVEKKSQSEEAMEVDDNDEKIGINKFTEKILQTELNKTVDETENSTGELMAKIARESYEKTNEERASGAVSRVRLHHTDNPADPLVTISQSEGEEKVRKRRRRRNERDGWAMRAWNARSYSKSCVKPIVSLQRLVLFPEICV